MATTVLLFTKDRMLTRADGIIVHSVRFSFDGPRYLSFGRDIRFDEDDVFSANDKISLTINGTTVFTGWISEHNPRLNTNETIEYRAAGPRSKLSGITLTRNNSATVIYNGEDITEKTTSKWTYRQIFQNIASKIPNKYVTSVSIGAGIMTATAPETSFIGMSIEDCLRSVIEKVGKVGYYITPQRQLRVVNLDSTISKKVYLGEIGEKVSDHSEYNVLNTDLNWSIAGAKTKCVIEGSRRRVEKYINLTPDWPSGLEKYWNISAYINGIAGVDLPLGDYNDIYRKYKFSDHLRVQTTLISENRGAFTEWQAINRTWFPYQASIDMVNRSVIFPTPVYGQRFKNIGLLSAGLVRSRAQARMKCVVEGERIKVTVGPTGTAYTNRNVTDEIYITDDSFMRENVARPGEKTPRNDISKMITIANELLEAVKDEQVTGTITLDGLDLTWGLENNIDIENAKDDKWTNLNALVLSINLNLENETTQLQLSTNKYLGAGPDYAELKRRLLVRQNIKKLEEKVNKLMIRAPSIIGSSTNLGEIQSSGDAAEEKELGTDETNDNIKAVVQQAFNENYFTIQTHDHVGAGQGGNAYAKKGAALL